MKITKVPSIMKKETETPDEQPRELTEEELKQVVGGGKKVRSSDGEKA